MKLISTRGGPAGGTWSFRDALFLGQAPDGGLFVPASLPRAPRHRFHPSALSGITFPERSFLAARQLLGDEIPDDLLRAVIHDTLDFPIPLREIEPGIHMLELFHGPTHAFKDVGARFMARMMSALRDDHAPPVTILAATSGDTGGAVAQAFFRVPGIRVVVLYPLGKVSPRQEAQFATLGGNVTAVAVRGAFDACQRLVREAFSDPALSARLTLTSANSINIGRLLPQTFYYLHAWAELAHTAPDSELVFSIPSGNFGNLTAGLIAQRALGMSLTRFVAATNDNSVVPEYLDGHGFTPRPSVTTISSAMDDGDPGNFRRILHLFGEAPPFTASSWTDRRDPRVHPRSVAQPGHRHRPAHSRGAARPARRDGAARSGRAGSRPGDGAPRQVRRDRRAPDRPRAAGASGDLAGDGPAAAFDHAGRRAGGAARGARLNASAGCAGAGRVTELPQRALVTSSDVNYSCHSVMSALHSRPPRAP